MLDLTGFPFAFGYDLWKMLLSIVEVLVHAIGGERVERGYWAREVDTLLMAVVLKLNA